MKKDRIRVTRRDLDVVSRGLRNSTRALVTWINEAPDKDTTKKRLTITAAVPLAITAGAAEAPAPVLSLSLAALGGTVFWFAREAPKTFTVQPFDHLGPFAVAGRVLDFGELLDHIAQRHPQANAQALGDILYEQFNGPDLTDAQMASQLRAYGICHAAAGSSSPTEEKASMVKPDAIPAAPDATLKEPKGEKGSDRASWIAHHGSRLKVSLLKVGSRRSEANNQSANSAT